MPDALTLILIFATFLLAGLVKGVVGLGLPTVSLGLLTAVLGLQPAMALMLAPSFLTNVWQALAGRHTLALLRRLGPFLLAAMATIWFGAAALSRVDAGLLSALLGLTLAVYALAGLLRPPLTLPSSREIWAGPLAGAVNGALTGMTGSFVVPGVMYLQALGLGRDELVQAMGMLFTASTLALAVALAGRSLLLPDMALLSLLAVIPAFLGMYLGRKLRHRIPERRFARIFFASLLLLAAHIVVTSL